MDSVQPWMRLKVKADTFCLPSDDGAVYFRNNSGSFRMEGSSVPSWIEKILPVLNGQHTLESLTEGLPDPYRDRIFQIANLLLENGFVRDVSADSPHQLSDPVFEYFRPQIEFIDNQVGSGAARLQAYRDTRVLVIGPKAALVPLVGSLWESGVESVALVVTDARSIATTHLQDVMKRFAECGIPVSATDITAQTGRPDSLRAAIREADGVVFVSPSGESKTLCEMEALSIEENRWFLPALCVDGLGFVGPMTGVTSDANGAQTWNDVWRRIHRSAFPGGLHPEPACTSIAVLVNVLVFELFKAMTGLKPAHGDQHFYRLNLETLQGAWHRLIPNQPIPGERNVWGADDVLAKLANPSPVQTVADSLSYLTQLTDPVSGVFHVWDEGDLSQLALSQCRVQPMDPLSRGPADLLVETVCAGFTHESVRVEAGFTGIEQYVQRLVGESLEGAPSLGIGTGATFAEAVWRGLHQGLVNELRQTVRHARIEVQRVDLHAVHDDTCNAYRSALRAMDVDPVIGTGQDLWGFPVVWVGVRGNFVGSVGLCRGMALQRVLEYILLRQTGDVGDDRKVDDRWVVLASDCAVREATDTTIEIDAWNGFVGEQQRLASAMKSLAQSGRNVSVRDLALEPFLRDGLAAIVGVSIRQGGSR